MTGNTPDISEMLDFDIWDLVWYHQPGTDTSEPVRRLGRWLGVAHQIGSDMCYWVIPVSGIVLARTTVQHVTPLELQVTELEDQVKEFDIALRERLSDSNFVISGMEETSGFYLPDIYDKEVFADSVTVPRDGDETQPEQDSFTPEGYDNMINTEIMIPKGDGTIVGKVIKRAKGEDGNPIGLRYSNPLLDTREYEVLMPDGAMVSYTTNVIAENLYSQVDSEGRQFLMLEEISDHRKDKTAYSKDDGCVVSHNGNKTLRQTTQGWQLSVQWKDGTSNWIALNDLKASNPIELAKYAVGNQLVYEPAFRWWVKDALRSRNRIISKVKSRYWKTTHKFGIEVPKDVTQALAIDSKTGTDFWRKAIEKEILNVTPAF
jgi:hypothetical protein